MSPRSPVPTLAAAACLLALALAAPLLASPVRGYGEQVFQANPVVGGGNPYYGVYAGATLAQSFQVTEDYLLTNVTLRVRNDGGGLNALVVSIHPDDPVRHLPVLGTRLASASWVTPNGGSVPVNWSFPFNPGPVLRAGTTYWIVAENNATAAPPADGYEWDESNADTYPGGSAFILNPSSGVWTGLPYDLFFVTVGRVYAPDLRLSLTANRATLLPGDSVTLTVAFNNTGNETAALVWLNTTLPGEFENASVAFPGVQPLSAAGFPNLVFANVTNGPHAFTITAQAAIGTPPGAVATTRASLDFENLTGTIAHGTSASASVTIGLVAKQLYLGNTSGATQRLSTTTPTSAGGAGTTLVPGAALPLEFLLDPALARPFVLTAASLTLWASTSAIPPQSYRLNVSLLDNATTVASLQSAWTQTGTGYQRLTFTFGSLNLTFGAGHRIGLSLEIASGPGGSTDSLLVRFNGTAYPSRLDLVTTTYVSVDDLALLDPASGGRLWSPLDPLVVQANVSDPFGASRIRAVTVNITSPGGSLVASGPMTLLTTDPSALPAWSLFGTSLAPPLALGAYRVDVTATEDNGVVDLARAYADVAAPSLSLFDTTSVGHALAGGAYAYYLDFNNSGTGVARSVWINDTLPSQVSYVASSLPYTSAVGNTYTWALTNVTVGSHRLEIDVGVPGTSTVPAWIRDDATLSYTDVTNHPVASLAASAVVFLNGPVLEIALTGSPSAGIHANQTAVWNLTLRNTGAASGTAWLNVTLPSGFTYVSDNAGPLGGALTQNGALLLYVFYVIPAGVNWTIQITTRSPAALAWNISYVDALTLDYASTNNFLMPRETAAASLLGRSAWISDAEITFVAPEASPGGGAPATLRILNSGNEAASRVAIDLAIDTRLSVTDASRPYTTGVGVVDFALAGVGMGWTIIYMNLSVSPSTVDGANLQMKGSLGAYDGVGNPLPTYTLTRTFVLITAADFVLGVSPSPLTLEAGAAAPLSIALQNLGGGDAANAWLNVTIPGTLLYVNDSLGIAPSIVGLAYSYHWSAPNAVLGAHNRSLFTITIAARLATPNGTAAAIGFTLDYQDSDLLTRPGLNQTLRVTVAAPTVVLRVEANADDLAAGQTLGYVLRVSNLGATIARTVSVQDDVDAHLQVTTYNSTVPAQGTQNLTWTFLDLEPGETETMTLTVQAVSGVTPGTDIANSLEASYTNSAGLAIGSVRSPPVTVHIVQDLTPVLWILGAAGVLATAVVTLRRRRDRSEIEEVFLVYRDGVLISHLSRTLMREKDEDVLSGMLTAVQEFVREAFQYGEHHDLHQLDFGDYRILIERGQYVYLAVVYSGEDSSAIHKKVQAVIELIETQLGDVLKQWDGDMEQVVGARELIRDTLLGTNGKNHTERRIPEYE